MSSTVKHAKARATRPKTKEDASGHVKARKTIRLEARVPPDIKMLAERAAWASGFNLTDYLVNLVRNDAPTRLKEHKEMVLSNERFDHFIAACEAAAKPSKKLQAAAKKLDQEGL